LPIQPGAQAIHGITDDDVADAPRWAEVVPRLLEVSIDRQVVCYIACVARAETTCAEISLGHLADDDRWGCVMRRSDWTRASRWLPLGGGHRAIGDGHRALGDERCRQEACHSRKQGDRMAHMCAAGGVSATPEPAPDSGGHVSAQVAEPVDLGGRLLDGAGGIVGGIVLGLAAADVIGDVGPRLLGAGAVRADDVAGR
jgi:hypothetical protein